MLRNARLSLGPRVMQLSRFNFKEATGPIAIGCKLVQSEGVDWPRNRCALCWSYNGLGRNRVSTQPVGRTDTRDGERSYNQRTMKEATGYRAVRGTGCKEGQAMDGQEARQALEDMSSACEE